MTTVNCIKYGKDQPAIPYPAYIGELGKKINQQISLKFWQEWLSEQTMIINENHFSPIDPEHRKIITEKMTQFLFEGKNVKPRGFEPEE